MAFSTFLNRKTGLIGQYPAEFGSLFDYLEEVDEDAKPLAYVPLVIEEGFTDPDTGFADAVNEEAEDAPTTPAKPEGKAK